ncbi:hypothetical protein [Marispirochaeta aestuarii]|uniref:hypothetical protein n=1 Tax=Marispirochaeta aestuarii TaxID=1963862 RepID=UPI0029C83A3F|nr:hypothetical protein [Marispirochaeta aestuarii]
MKDYCTQNDGDCRTCSMTSYGRDCMNNPLNDRIEYVITEGSCNGEEQQFSEFVKRLHPDWNVSVDVAYMGGLFVNGERAEDQPDLWDQYCGA